MGPSPCFRLPLASAADIWYNGVRKLRKAGGMIRMKERRQYKRYSIQVNGKASDDSHQNYQFIMNNISAGGMSITTEKELKDESPLTIQLDKAQLRLPRTKPLKGMIVRKKEESDAYHYGIRFTGLTKTETQEMDTYLRDEHFASLAQMVKNPDDMDNKK